MAKINVLVLNPRIRTALKVGGAILALMGLIVAGIASEPVIFPN